MKIGGGSFEEVAAVLLQLGCKRPLLVTDPFMVKAGLVERLQTQICSAGLSCSTFSDTLPDPTSTVVERGAALFQAGGHDSLVSLGGGSPIWRELPACFSDPGNRKARERMMLAATQAGIAFSNASVALVHGMSRPLGVHFHVPHGLSNAMLLPAATAFSASAALARYAVCARTMGMTPEGSSDEQAVEALLDGLHVRNRELNVPSPRQFGIDKERYLAAIPVMTAQALASGSPQNNPRVPTAEEISELYRRVWQ